MADPFYSPRLTFIRAQYHVRELKTMLNDFIDKEPWAYIVDTQSQPGKIIHKIKLTQSLPEMAPCILFDVANNLRAVLDQTAYAAAVAGGIISSKGTNFPFGDDLAQLENNITGRKVCEKVPSEIVALFRTFEPYKGGNGETLWALNKLCNAKKHCALVPLDIGNAAATFQGEVSGKNWTSQANTGIGWDTAKRELVLLIAAAGRNANISGNITFQVAIDGIDALRKKPVSIVLDELSGIVEGILMRTEAECSRLGLKLD